MITPTVWIFLGVFCIKTNAFSQGTRLLRQPTLSKDQVAFVYADDLWIVQKNGGAARRLTSHEGSESVPHFSPDGKWIAFSVNPQNGLYGWSKANFIFCQCSLIFIIQAPNICVYTYKTSCFFPKKTFLVNLHFSFGQLTIRTIRMPPNLFMTTAPSYWIEAT